MKQQKTNATAKAVPYKLAFTLVELIVVITILAILGTIAFISLQGYSAQSRDATRISDLSVMKTSLELFQLDAGKYPLPSDGIDMTYSGGVVWNQGTFGDSTYKNVDSLNKIPVDPITDKKYTYSTTSNRQEYQLAGLIESLDFVSSLNILDGAYAGENEAIAVVTGNYNGLMLKSLSGSDCNILSLPSIISSQTTSTTDIVDILSANGLVFNGYNNLPTNYISSKYKTNGGFEFSPNKLLVHTDSGSCAELSNQELSRVNLLTALQESYSGTILESNFNISKVLSYDVNADSGKSYIKNVVTNGLQINTSGEQTLVPLLGEEGNPGVDCKNIIDGGGNIGDGEYWIKPNAGAKYQAYCDMTTDGGGWTLVANRRSSLSDANFWQTQLNHPIVNGEYWDTTWSDYNNGISQSEVRLTHFDGTKSITFDISVNYSASDLWTKGVNSGVAVTVSGIDNHPNVTTGNTVYIRYGNNSAETGCTDGTGPGYGDMRMCGVSFSSISTSLLHYLLQSGSTYNYMLVGNGGSGLGKNDGTSTNNSGQAYGNYGRIWLR